MAKRPSYAMANGRTFKIVEETGKAPFKLIFLSAEGSEYRRTHHKTEALAAARAHLFNPNIPVVK